MQRPWPLPGLLDPIFEEHGWNAMEVRSFFLRRLLNNRIPYDAPIRDLHICQVRVVTIFRLNEQGQPFIEEPVDVDDPRVASRRTLYVRFPWWEPFWKRTPRKEDR